MTTLIKDLIDLPERVHSGDFVLRLAEGVTHPEETLRTYVVTPQLEQCFDEALDFVKSALDSRSSKASYLHGSFGSGKSHFMAVLHLLLQNHPQARSIPELAKVVAEHTAWTEGRKFLLIPYHMIGARSLESAILGGYVHHVRKLHPQAPVPGVYKTEGLFRDAADLRKTLGDETFFARLNRNAGQGRGGWGALETTWDAASFEGALVATPGSEERSRLIGTLIEEFFRSYTSVTHGSEEAFVTLDEGFSVISRHARDLGCDALILFLDELILWLATHATDQAFLNQEGAKLAKLVEAQSADRPIPVVSFVARQHDLRDLVGQNVTGAEQLRFADVLSWWDARFHRITLEDRNLPDIAGKRILRPKSESARQQIDHAFRETEKVREEVLSTLLTPRADRSIFRKVYPFSPALVETLVAVSSVLQRERTALKVMLQLLVSQRDTLDLGQIVPVGDLFDAIAEGDEPFMEAMRFHFENAKRLYYRKLLPMLEKEHGVTAEELRSVPESDPRVRAFRGGDRILKTLLLAALVPQVDVLKGLTVARLAALNHGSIRTPIPGQESGRVLSLCRNWAAQVGELKLGDDPQNPTVSLQLSGVDTEGILAAAEREDSQGNRRRKIRELLFKDLGVTDRDELFVEHPIEWRGTSRGFEVVFGNVRELTDESLSATEGARKVVIDFPFDPGHSPEEDLERLDTFRHQRGASRALVWLPSFLSASAQRDLGTLVKLDHILSGERFKEYASHLSAVDQAAARDLLRNQRDQLTFRITQILQGAYGVSQPLPDTIDTSFALDEHFQSLDPSFDPRPPVGASLKAAFEHLLRQMLESQYPAHPDFPIDVKLSSLKKVWAELEKAIQEKDGRIAIDKPLRPLMKGIAEPLQLGEMGETHWVLGHRWVQHFHKKEAEGGGPITVARLRSWMDEPRPMGLPRETQNLVILTFANQTNRSFYLHGGSFQTTLDNVRDEIELREQTLPALEEWQKAVERAASVFGESFSALLNATNVGRMQDVLAERAGKARSNALALSQKLRSRMQALEMDEARAPRFQTALAGQKLVDALASRQGHGLIEAFARAPLVTSDTAVGTSIEKAERVVALLESQMWEVFEALSRLQDERREEVKRILTEVREALRNDEYALALEAKLAGLHSRALKLLAPPPVLPRVPPPAGRTVLEQGESRGLDASSAKALLKALERKITEKNRLDVSWTFYEDEDS